MSDEPTGGGSDRSADQAGEPGRRGPQEPAVGSAESGRGLRAFWQDLGNPAKFVGACAVALVAGAMLLGFDRVTSRESPSAQPSTPGKHAPSRAEQCFGETEGFDELRLPADAELDAVGNPRIGETARKRARAVCARRFWTSKPSLLKRSLIAAANPDYGGLIASERDTFSDAGAAAATMDVDAAVANPLDGAPFYVVGRVDTSEPLTDQLSEVQLVGARKDRVVVVDVASGDEPENGEVVAARVFLSAKGPGRFGDSPRTLSVAYADAGVDSVVSTFPTTVDLRVVDRFSPPRIRRAAKAIAGS